MPREQQLLQRIRGHGQVQEGDHNGKLFAYKTCRQTHRMNHRGRRLEYWPLSALNERGGESMTLNYDGKLERPHVYFTGCSIAKAFQLLAVVNTGISNFSVSVAFRDFILFYYVPIAKEKKTTKIFMFSVYLSLAWALDGAATHASVKQVGPQIKN